MSFKIFDIRKIIFAFILLLMISSCDFIEGFREGFERGRKSSLYWALLSELRHWAAAFEKYHLKYNEYPTSDSIDELKNILTPFHDREFDLRTIDPWEEKYLVKSSREQYTISSKGDDKIGGHEFGGVLDTDSYKHSITLKNGVFVQYLKLRSKSVKEFEEEIINIKKSEINKSN